MTLCTTFPVLLDFYFVLYEVGKLSLVPGLAHSLLEIEIFAEGQVHFIM